MAYAQLKSDIAAVIRNNGNQEITGNVLQGALLEMINAIGANYQYAGVADTSTTITTTEANVFYLLTEAGTYSNMSSSIVHTSGIGIALWNGTAWSYQNVPSSAIVATDATPTEGSTNPVQSGGVWDEINTTIEKNLTGFASWTTGYINNGNVTSDSSISHTNYIYVGGFDKIKVLMIKSVSASDAGLAFYNSSKTYMSPMIKPNSGASERTTEERIIDIPTNAVFIRTSMDNTQLSNFYIYGIKSNAQYLNEKVDSLEESVSNLETQTIGDNTVKNYGSFNRSKNVVATPNSVTTSLIPVSQNDIVAVKNLYYKHGVTSSDKYWLLLNSSKIPSDYAVSDNPVKIGSGVSYIMACVYDDSEACVEVNGVVKWKNNAKSVKTQLAEFETMTNNGRVSIPCSGFLSGFTRASDGTTGTDSNSVYTPYIDISSFSTIAVTMGVSTSSGSGGLCFYDSSFTFISSITNRVDSSAAANTIEERLLSVPSNAKYIRTFIYKAKMEDWYMYGVKESSQDTYINLGKNLTWQSGAISYQTGLPINSMMGAMFTNFIDIEGYDYIKLPLSVSTSSVDSCVCIYDENETVLFYQRFRVSSSAGSDDITIQVPSGAKYLRTTYINSDLGNFYIYGVTSSYKYTLVKQSSFKGGYPAIIGSPQLYISDSIADTETEINNMPVADLYSAWDELVTNHPEFLKKNTDLGTVTRSSDSEQFAVRSYTFGFNKPVLINHEPGTTEVISASDNLWISSYNPRKILLTSGMHGEEKVPTVGLMLAIKEILESTEQWAYFIKSNFIFEIIPCLNPAGWDACTRAASTGVEMNRDEAIDAPESTIYMNWVSANKDAFVLIDVHGTQGRYAYTPVMPNSPIHNLIVTLTSQLSCALYNSNKVFWNSISNGYGTTYAPFLVSKDYSKTTNYWTRGRYDRRMFDDYGMLMFILETPDNLVNANIASNDKRNCKITKELVINFIQMIAPLDKLVRNAQF